MQGAHDQALALELSRAGLAILRQATDLIRIAAEWEVKEGTMVCPAPAQVSKAKQN